MFSFWDFNSLYLYSQDQELPLGPGVIWEKTELSSVYKKRPMAQGVSKGQIEWLLWMQHQPVCIDRNGQRQTIRHAMNFGEVEVNGRPVDGHMIKDGVDYFFEYLGCYWHPGCCIPDSMIKGAEAKRKSDTEKWDMLRNRGIVVNIINI